MKAATVYASRGFRVVPLYPIVNGQCSCSDGPTCRAAGKHPRIGNWAELATNAAAVVGQWVDQFPTANIGLATGEGSGVFALDVDPDNGGDVTLAALIAEHGPLPETATQRTGSGGTHYLFAWPGFNVTNSAGKLGKGLDVRGNGGQIVVAPSVSLKGPYAWVKAPWDVKPTPAPEWLLAMLRPRAASKVSTATPASRRFGLASETVLDAARAALAALGPAIEGNGGDNRTFVAASILSHDFALTEDEGMALFREWNETCDPPWSEEDLLAKYRGSAKYAKGQFGAKRVQDALETARRMINEAAASGVTDPSSLYLELEQLPYASEYTQDDVVNLCKASFGGSGPKLPPIPAPYVVHEGEIEMTPRLALVADDAVKAIKDDVFQRAGVLCEVVQHDSLSLTVINELEPARVQDLMSRTTRFVRYDLGKGMMELAAPERVATLLAARRKHPDEIRVLESVTTAPIFLRDGTILHQVGYNEAARVFLQPSVQVTVPETPGQDDARAALARLHDVFHDVPFLEPADRDVLTAAILTPLVKSATGNAPAPLFVISASSAGSGKTLVGDVVARIVSGRAAEVRPYTPFDEGEWSKRITSYVKAGATVNVFDNVNGVFGDSALDRLITAPAWSDRILGASEAPPLPNVGLWLVTGNNCEPEGDTIRRCAVCRLDIRDERPAERQGFRHPELADWVQENRAALLSDALTILRAWHVAGRPSLGLPAWGSFSAWGSIVRNAIVWAGGADPWLTQKRLQADANEAENDTHDFWIRVIEATDSTPAAISAQANAYQARQVLNTRDDVNPHSLRKFLHRFLDKPRGGKRIRRLTGGGYTVDKV